MHRTPLVTDASVIAAALFGEAAHAEAIALLHGRDLHAPHLLDLEIASVGLKKVRREKVASQVIGSALQSYTQLSIERHPVNAAGVVALAERYDLTPYDAAYLYVAQILSAPLATFDGRLAAAARTCLADTNQIHELG